MYLLICKYWQIEEYMGHLEAEKFHHPYSCTVDATLSVIGGRWKPVIIFQLLHNEYLRFGELKRRIEGITERMLTKQLRELEADDIVIRKVYAEVPPRVEYSLTDYGKTLKPILMTMREWGAKHLDIEYHEPFGCSVEATLAAIGARWKPVIIFRLLEHDILRFGELKHRIDGITERMLTNQLRELERDSIVNRKVYAEVPPRVEYTLSEYGQTLKPILFAMREWGARKGETDKSTALK